MDEVRFRRVSLLAVVPHVLRAVEGPEVEAIEEVARMQEARHRPHTPPRLCLQVVEGPSAVDGQRPTASV